ncbi:hypothetical protein [Paenibacillus tarimensis]|uniref:hypothetical protein n=1 Tax=Paenibacillus tarimensis TaxID=416012 RepID=UPI001F3B548C|nr:hypothetical protein [Paenibacillus tarimensis]MCF2943178.1 hypothetical protein [Paenibacillus tarimensis]
MTSKIAASGLVFLGLLAVLGGFDGYNMWKISRELPLWGFIYGYALLFSVAVDALLYKLKKGPSKMAVTVLLYILGGYVPLLYWFQSPWYMSLIAGAYGVACALVYLAAAYLFRRWWPYSTAAAILLLAVAIYVSTSDFTVTKQWVETRTADSYYAEFDYFNGKKEIPISLDAGQTLTYQVDWQITNGGGYGMYLDAEDGAIGTYIQEPGSGTEQISYRVERPSTVQIVVTGNRAQGAVTVTWQITGPGDE